MEYLANIHSSPLHSHPADKLVTLVNLVSQPASTDLHPAKVRDLLTAIYSYDSGFFYDIIIQDYIKKKKRPLEIEGALVCC